jgi:hypothetical protein
MPAHQILNAKTKRFVMALKFRFRNRFSHRILRAYHEAGHVVVARHHGITLFTAQIHLVPIKFGRSGYTDIKPLVSVCTNRWRIRAHIDMYLAGQAADEIVTYGRNSDRYRTDRRYALRHIFELLASFGNECPSDEQVIAEFVRGLRRSKTILYRNRDTLDRVARLLARGQSIALIPRYHEKKQS